MTTSTQCVRIVADSHRKKSMLQRLSFAWPRKVSHEDDEIVLTPLNCKKYRIQKYHASRVTIQGVMVELVRRAPFVMKR